ncbi:MAG: hypothetical protein GYA23_05090 [Methanomicrobiales archaeon]|nr:hypothetical protein [Methanomicrobiales archaeon]
MTMKPDAETTTTGLGWCPHTAPSRQNTKGNPSRNCTADKKDKAQGPVWAHVAMPDGFTALSLIILFATCFVGGFLWWPALVLGITAAGILTLWARSDTGSDKWRNA